MSISFFFYKLILNLMIFYMFHIVLRDKSRTYEESRNFLLFFTAQLEFSPNEFFNLTFKFQLIFMA